jgi:hypothetical protein
MERRWLSLAHGYELVDRIQDFITNEVNRAASFAPEHVSPSHLVYLKGDPSGMLNLARTGLT